MKLLFKEERDCGYEFFKKILVDGSLTWQIFKLKKNPILILNLVYTVDYVIVTGL